MMERHMLRKFPFASPLFFQEVPPNGANAAISLPPSPAPPVIVLRVTIALYGHPVGMLQVESVSAEWVGCLLEIEERLASIEARMAKRR